MSDGSRFVVDLGAVERFLACRRGGCGRAADA